LIFELIHLDAHLPNRAQNFALRMSRWWGMLNCLQTTTLGARVATGSAMNISNRL
jgi:hypothetical protein